MRSLFFILISSNLFFVGCRQVPTAEKVLQKSIEYHDPNNNWKDFNDSLRIVLSTPQGPDRTSTVYLNNRNNSFYVRVIKDSIKVEFKVTPDECKLAFNGNENFTEEEAEKNGLSCDRAAMYKDYYTYLYGLPMKLRDPGTNINPKVEKRAFKGKEYLVLRADYDAEVGTDIWFFYFDPKTYALEVYQFFRKDVNGQLKEDTGEYILLREEAEIGGIRMPKTRAWYYNKDDKYLGKDILK